MTTAKITQWASIRGFCHAKVVIQVRSQDISGNIPVLHYPLWLESQSPGNKTQAQVLNELAAQMVDGFNLYQTKQIVAMPTTPVK